MICAKCGSQTPDDTKFCTECGSPIAEPAGQQQPYEPAPQPEQAWQQPYEPKLQLEQQPYESAPQPQPEPAGQQWQQPYEPAPQPEPAGQQWQQPYSYPAPEQTWQQQQQQPYGAASQPLIKRESFLTRVAIPVLFMVVLALIFTFVVFVLIDTQPGDPAAILLGPGATEEELQKARSELRMDSPLIVRYSRAMIGDYGDSYMTRQPVREMVKERISTTIKLLLAALAVTLIISLPLGIASAVKRNKLVDALSGGLTMVFRSIPFFVIALATLLWFAIGLRWLPVAGVNTWQGYILPAIALGLPCTGFATKAVRATAIKVSNYGMRGLIFPGSTDSALQPLQDAILPSISISGLQLGWLFGGIILIEPLFAFPGVGQMLIVGIMYRDKPVILGAVMPMALCFIIIAIGLAFAVGAIVFALTPKKVRGKGI